MRIEAHRSVVDDVHCFGAEELLEASEDTEISSSVRVSHWKIVSQLEMLQVTSLRLEIVQALVVTL